ncbi:hypothetical protein ALC60_05347 [Trachymyrmex zeteki]|uniref:Uncharacterized protein n=1 Tax=Mycetomoellerius zeteki TaxID=64791 RepID=A0A151X5L8_9HYME|nr:PREDICTED: uncharacterized protein LOC108722483 [Trachymyrmex zeteki]XP_018303134.1 PREDICTED: uncharacterized protein LOC108722483 [Trachymyrmex zeteki]KYQ55705.1 hypothetical protein ALC60_05347 [Trachymyrmex zeteki]
MARTLTCLMALNMSQIERLVVRPIGDMLTVEDDDFTMKSVGEDYQDMSECNTEFKKRIVPVVTIEETEDNVSLDGNLTYDDGVKKWDQISVHQTGILVEESFEIEENPHIDIKEKEERKEVINWRLAPVDHSAVEWNRDEVQMDEVQMDEVQMDKPCTEQSHVEQPHTEQPRAEQPHVEQLRVEEPCVELLRAKQPRVELLRVDESRDLRVINPVAITPSSTLQTQNGEFRTIEEIKEEEERLMTEIEKRGELQKTINERVARIKRMREFLEKFDDIEETEAKEENVEMEKRLNEAIDAYLTAGGQSKSFSDKFTIVDNNGQSTCEASMVVTLKNKRLRKNIQESKMYRITYDITGSEINRSYCVFTSDDTTSRTNKARKTTETRTSEIITRSMNLRRNLSTKSNSNKAAQVRKREKRNTQWSLKNRKRAYKSKERKGRDPMTIVRNEKGRFVKKKVVTKK